MATCGAYKFKVARTAILKKGLTVGEKLACPVKSTGHAYLWTLPILTKKDGFLNCFDLEKINECLTHNKTIKNFYRK